MTRTPQPTTTTTMRTRRSRRVHRQIGFTLPHHAVGCGLALALRGDRPEFGRRLVRPERAEALGEIAGTSAWMIPSLSSAASDHRVDGAEGERTALPAQDTASGSRPADLPKGETGIS